MSKLKDLTGNRYGRLTIVRYKESKNNRTYWEAKCDCGKTVAVRADRLKDGRTKSCGCLLKEMREDILSKGRTVGIKRCNGSRKTHGFKGTRFYGIWFGMKGRCNNPNNKSYSFYGGRGIKVCERWNKFINFKDDMYESYQEHVIKYGEKNTSIDRIDYNGDYFPKNCRWATEKEQQQNKSTNLHIIYNNKEYIASELARKYNLKPSIFICRLNYGWSIEEALYTPVKLRKKKIAN